MVDASLLRLVEVAVERKWLRQQVALQSAASVTHIVKYVQKVNYYKCMAMVLNIKTSFHIFVLLIDPPVRGIIIGL